MEDSKNLSLEECKDEPGTHLASGSLSAWRVWMVGVLIVGAGLLAYHNSYNGPFIFDDVTSISGNPSIARLWPPWQALSPPAGGRAVQRRPIVNFSLAVNYALGQLRVRGYHQFNVGVHILAGLVLFGVLRRTLLSERLGDRFGRASWPLALACTLIWLVHPLQTNAVTYIIQRTELLAGLFYLLTLYCVIRAAGSTESRWWYVAAVFSCLLGIGSKEIVASAPLVILLYDRLFLSGSFREALRRRWGLYVGLAATWGLVVVLIPHGTAGASFGTLDYAPKQFAAITTYLRLCFWPSPLNLDYGPGETPSLRQALPYAVFIITLLVGTILAIRYKPAIGFLGVWFFAILAPSSSLIALNEWAAEKRMYLPLAVVVIIVVLSGYTLAGRLVSRLTRSARARSIATALIGYCLLGVVLVILSFLTIKRNAVYQTVFSIWNDAIAKQPDNWRALTGRGWAYAAQGNYIEAMRDYNEAIELNPNYARVYNNRGLAYAAKRNYDKAIRDYNQAIKLKSEYIQPYYNRGTAHLRKKLYGRAIRDFSKVIELEPRTPDAFNNRGIAYYNRGDYDRAISDYNEAIRLIPQFAIAYTNRGLAYRDKGDNVRAMRDLNKARELSRPKP